MWNDRLKLSRRVVNASAPHTRHLMNVKVTYLGFFLILYHDFKAIEQVSYGHSWSEHNHVIVNATGCGFDFCSRKWKYLIFSSFWCRRQTVVWVQPFNENERTRKMANRESPSAYLAVCGIQRETETMLIQFSSLYHNEKRCTIRLIIIIDRKYERHVALTEGCTIYIHKFRLRWYSTHNFFFDSILQSSALQSLKELNFNPFHNCSFVVLTQ